MTPASTHTYEVRARDAAGNVSSESNAASATTPAPDTVPPSAPSNLDATAVGPTEVDLSWTAAIDETELGGYDVYRDGALVDSVDATTTFADTTATPATTHSDRVVAFDTSGNMSDPSNTVGVDTPQPPTEIVVDIAEDATVRENRPDRNYGDDVEFDVDASSNMDGLLKFAVPDFGGQALQQATLRLFVVNSSSSGGSFAVTDNGWSESTWNSAPAAGAVIGSPGDVSSGTWVELDVTDAITGSGDVSFRASSTKPNGVGYQSKEGGPSSAQLVLRFG